MTTPMAANLGAAGGARVLLLHPEDDFSLWRARGRWDLIVDFGRAPASTYERWSKEAGIPVIGLYSFVERPGDLYRVYELLQLGMGRLVDRCGIDWWDALRAMNWIILFQVLLLQRLVRQLPPGCEVYMSRLIPEANALRTLAGAAPVSLESGNRFVLRRMARPLRAISQLSAAQTFQIIQDKFDQEHVVRKRLTRRPPGSGKPAVLLPSAYINVSRTAAAYGALLPEENFLLVYARRVARLSSPPANIREASLDGYFVPPNRAELADLSQRWLDLKQSLLATDEFAAADAAGMLSSFPSLLRWGVAVRDAWQRVFEYGKIAACLCADDGNPYTLIPLLLARQRGLPTLSCHHGAFDYTMAVKGQRADFYLAKSEMERDYLANVCRVAPEEIVVGAPISSQTLRTPPAPLGDRRCAVLFTEPYTLPWRSDEIYGDLVRALSALCGKFEFQLILKVHPFENVKSYRRSVERWLPRDAANRVEIVAGATSSDLWSKMRFALTAESTIALECHERGVKVFLCRWLQDSYTGYAEQYAKFGVGHLLDSVERVADIPGLLEPPVSIPPVDGSLPRPIDLAMLRNWLHGANASPTTCKS